MTLLNEYEDFGANEACQQSPTTPTLAPNPLEYATQSASTHNPRGTTAINSSVRRSIVPAATTPASDDYDDEPLNTAFPLLIADDDVHQKSPPEPIRFDEGPEKSNPHQATIDDIAMRRFNNAAGATFLHSAAPEVRRKFERVWNDDDIPSESLRNLKIHTLAVSLLTAKQLEEYNRWATKRRYVLKARERELSHLSAAAKRALRRISNRCTS
ncbi:unnamed protein product [Haemonchus placei]|uniref:Uncharacterized protein n=1 Tax=Haemonchus placei TaxID=6290 RepID=A0A0N4W5E3_HAEPC|nr:unnamed protein product [Haemonchus placei]